MSLTPKKQKYKKQQKGRAFNKIGPVFTLNSLSFGSYGLKTLESGRISSKQLESLYQCLNKIIKKTGRVVLTVFPHTPISKKPIEVRMGKGKGNVDSWVAKIKAGRVICEIITNSKELAIKALHQAQLKLPIKTISF